MVMLKELAVEMLNNLPAENLENKPQHNDKMAALKEIQKYRGKLPEDFNYKKELEESREDRYAGIN